jgi:rsbT co-antagonist protein RsbR
MADGIAVASSKNRLTNLLQKREQEIATKWLERQGRTLRRMSAAEQEDTARQSREFLNLLRTAAHTGAEDLSSPSWQPVREFLTDFSASRAKSGYTPSETASFIFSLKQPLFEALREECGKDADALAEEVWRATELLDSLGLLTAEAFQKSREDVISRQQQEMLELSTPVVQLWTGILALPLIGTLDSAHASGDAEPAGGDRQDALGLRHHRHYRCARGGYSGGAAPAQDSGRRAAYGRRMHD